MGQTTWRLPRKAVGSVSYPEMELLARQGTPALRLQCCPRVMWDIAGRRKMQRLNESSAMGKCKACFFPGKR